MFNFDCLAGLREEGCIRKVGDVTLEHSPITMNEAGSVMEACDQMRNCRAGSVLVIDNCESLVGLSTGRVAVCRVAAHRSLG